MERFWRSALATAGIGAIAFFVFYGLYKQWLQLSIFPRLTQGQAFTLMLVFLGLTFCALIVGLIAWLKRGGGDLSEEAAVHRLEQAWKDVNYIDCDQLIGPDVNRAANALQLTALYWRKNYIGREVLVEKYGENYCELFEQMNKCNKQVPGYSKPEKYCRDFLPAPVRSTYTLIKKALGRLS